MSNHSAENETKSDSNQIQKIEESSLNLKTSPIQHRQSTEDVEILAQDGHAIHFEDGHALVGRDATAEARLRLKVTNLFFSYTIKLILMYLSLSVGLWFDTYSVSFH